MIQAGPSSNINGSFRDWWTISAPGTFDGKVYAAGDIIVGLGASYYDAYFKGRPDRGQKFLAGEWSAATALPTTYGDGWVWQVTAAGTAGGITFAVDDWLVRFNGVWGRIASEPITETTAGGYVSLRCNRGASEWEARRKDKATSPYPVILQGLVQPTRRTESLDNSAVLYSHSIGDFLRSALTAAFGSRPLTVKAFNSAGGQEIVSCGAEADIINGVVPTGKLIMGCSARIMRASVHRRSTPISACSRSVCRTTAITCPGPISAAGP